jgi:hypothetical protein
MSFDIVGASNKLTNENILGQHLIKILTTTNVINNNNNNYKISKFDKNNRNSSINNNSSYDDDDSNSNFDDDDILSYGDYIYYLQVKKLQYLYTSLSCLLLICETERNIRRKVIISYSEIVNNFQFLDPYNSILPLLQLLSLCCEYLNKIEYEDEICIVQIIYRALISNNYNYIYYACELISRIQLER